MNPTFTLPNGATRAPKSTERLRRVRIDTAVNSKKSILVESDAPITQEWIDAQNRARVAVGQPIIVNWSEVAL